MALLRKPRHRQLPEEELADAGRHLAGDIPFIRRKRAAGVRGDETDAVRKRAAFGAGRIPIDVDDFAGHAEDDRADIAAASGAPFLRFGAASRTFGERDFAPFAGERHDRGERCDGERGVRVGDDAFGQNGSDDDVHAGDGKLDLAGWTFVGIDIKFQRAVNDIAPAGAAIFLREFRPERLPGFGHVVEQIELGGRKTFVHVGDQDFGICSRRDAEDGLVAGDGIG